MSKTIKIALKDDFRKYSISDGFFENRLIERDLNGDDLFTSAVSKSKPYRGAIADCCRWLILFPHLVEGDITISPTEKKEMLKIANSIYQSIGEEPVDVADKPIVYIES